MWIAGLGALGKPLLHLHTQANVSLPWSQIDMDFMNLNQAAHGDREFGYLEARMGRDPQGRHGSRDRPHCGGADRGLGAGGGRPADRPVAADGPLRRQHARRRRNRGRQSRGPAAVRLLDQHLRRVRTGRGRGRGHRQGGRRARRRVRRDLRGRPRAAAGRRTARLTAVRGPDRDRPAGFPRRRRLHRVHHQLPGPRRAAAAARAGGAAADGRRLRLRRRGRLEDRGAAAGAEGRCPPAGRVGRPSWRTTPTTSGRASS